MSIACIVLQERELSMSFTMFNLLTPFLVDLSLTLHDAVESEYALDIGCARGIIR